MSFRLITYVRTVPTRLTNERGEVASWLILGAALAVIAASLGPILSPKFTALAQRVGGSGPAPTQIEGSAPPGQLIADNATDPLVGTADDDHTDHGHAGEDEQAGEDDHAGHDHDLPADNGFAPTLDDGTAVSDDLVDTRGDFIDTLDAGNDDRLTDSEVEELLDIFDGLSDQEKRWLWESLSAEQQALLLAHLDPTEVDHADLLDVLQGDYPLETRGEIVAILDDGDDDLSDTQVKAILDLFEGLTDQEALALWESLSQNQQATLLAHLDTTDSDVAALLDVFESDYPIETRAEIVDILEAGNDDRLTDDETRQIVDHFLGLTDQEALELWSSLSEEQRQRLVDNLATTDLSDPALVDLLDLFAGTYPLETRSEILEILEAGNDDTLFESEIAELVDLFDGLSNTEASAIWDTLSEDQKARLIDNFLGDEPTDAEIADFLAVFEDISDYPLDVIARDDPELSGYDQALADAVAESANDPARELDLITLTNSEGFDELDYHQKTALLAQFTHHDDGDVASNLLLLAGTDSFQDLSMSDAQRAAKTVAFMTTYEPPTAVVPATTGMASPGPDTTVMDNTLALILGEDAQIPLNFEADGRTYGQATSDGEIKLNPAYIPAGNDPIDPADTGALRVLTHTVAHEVNHVVNEDRVASTYEYFMGEYRAFYVGQTATYGREPTRAEVIDRVEVLVSSEWDPDGDNGAYAYLDLALEHPEEGPKIAAFVSEVLGREVTVENIVAEVQAGATDPGEAAAVPVSVDGGPNNLTNQPS